MKKLICKKVCNSDYMQVKGLILITIFFFPVFTHAQSYLPFDKYNHYQRILQISGIDESGVSFNIRPVTSPEIHSDVMHPWRHLRYDTREPISNINSKFNIYAFEQVWFQSYNSALPRGINDGAIWQGKGFNSALSFGLRLEYGPVQINFRPVLGWSQNKSYNLGPYEPPIIRVPSQNINEQASDYAYRDFHGRFDYVQRFGENAVSWLDMGLSSLELKLSGFKFALSNQHIWSGPAIHSSLQYGYNAPGFRHVYVGSDRPLHTPLGSIEFAYIFGRMLSSEYFLDNQQRSQSVNSFILSYSPFFSDNFHIGALRTFFHHYPENFSEYSTMALKLFEFLFRDSYDDWDADNQIASLFFRYVISDFGVELYGEYGRNDHNADMRDFRAQYNHSRAYTIGVTKTAKLNRQRILATNVEFTQTESTRPGLTRGERNIGGRLGGWYGHSHQVMGFTNRGQIIGSGYGPGFNSQIIKTDVYDTFGKVGLKLARIVYHNNRVDQSFEFIRQANIEEVERWEVRNVELMAGLEWVAFLRNDIELSVAIEQSYIYNQHNLKDNDYWNTRIEFTLRKNIRGWLR